MVVNKRSKNVRQRAKTTHGYGSMKKNRGAGHRGGRGKAGSGKRGDAKKPSFWKNSKYFGKYGFTPRDKSKLSINLRQIDDNADSWTAKGKIIKKSDTFVIDLGKLGYDKLLGTGKVTKKFEILVDYASPKAVSKVEEAGGNVKLQLQDVFEPVEDVPEEAKEE